MKLIAALTLLVSTVALAQPPTPESVLGHKPGDDFYLASYDEALGYLQKLEKSTDKMKLVKVGKTTQGRDWYIAIISSARNLADLNKYKDTARRLALVKGLNDQQAHELAHNGKVIVHIDGGLHATEVACAQHTIQLAYNLVTGKDPETTAILDNVILMLWFSINPDGQNMVVDWYRGNVGTPYEVSNMPGLWQEYVGHDNNRDGYMNNMIESQVITKTELEYYPTVFYNHHQTAPFPARIWIPPFGDPVSLNPHPLMYRWVNVFGTAMAAYLDEHNMPGAMHRGEFDDWYPGFVDHVNNFRNTVSFLTETALYRYATPHFYTTDEFPRDKQALRAEIYYSSPWKGGWWRLGDAVRYMLGASTAVLDTAAKNREQLLYDRYRAGRDVVAHFTQDPPYAYIIPRDQRDPVTAAILMEKLMTDGIEVNQASRDFSSGGAHVKEGDWMVLMDQPFAALVKELFDIQKYPEMPRIPMISDAAAGGAAGGGGGGGRGGGGRGGAAAPAAAPAPAAPAAAPDAGGRGGGGRGGGGRGGGGGGATPAAAAGGAVPEPGAQAAPAQLPYDVTGWTLPLQMGVEVIPVTRPVAAEERAVLHKLDHIEPVQGKVSGAGPVFSFSHDSNASTKAVNDILAGGGSVAFSKTGSTVYATGKVDAILQKDSVNASSLKDTPDSWPVKAPRIAIYEPWSGNIDEGWTRWIMEQFHFPFARVRNADIRDGHLRDQYDTIILAEMGTRQIMDGMSPSQVPGQFAGGIGEDGAESLRDFVTAGGTLIAFGNATLFAVDQFNLPLTNVVAGVGQNRFFCSGSLLKVEIKEPANPVVAGLPLTLPVMFERNPVFDARPGFRGKVLASYVKDRNPLVSGFLLGADLIQGKAAALDANYGSGHIILLAFRPQWRGQSHGTYKFFFNAIYYNPAMAEPESGRGGRGGRGGGGGGNAQQGAWRREAESVKTELSRLLALNVAYFTARGPRAAEDGKTLETALDAFQRDRIPALEDLRAQVEDAAASRNEATYIAQIRKFASDMRTRDLSTSRLDDLLEQYKLTVVP